MIAFDRHAKTFTITDLGRIAAKYYIRYKSIEVFNEKMKPKMTEADVLSMLCKSTEVRGLPVRLVMALIASSQQFEQIQVRENELPELELFMEAIPCAVEVRVPVYLCDSV